MKLLSLRSVLEKPMVIEEISLSEMQVELGEPLVQMRGIVKIFPGVVANDNVDFDLYAGEVHALLGENGAGKTTLMNILFGLYSPDEGEIYVAGKKVEIRSPRDAIRYGIGMVHQHFKLIPTLTVAENIALSLANAPAINPSKHLVEEIERYSKRYGLEVDPSAYVWQLSVGERQRVEILKALMGGARALILDEPTTVLTPDERDELFKTLRRMADEGCGIVLITHKLEEALSVCDRITVMRNGRVVATVRPNEVVAADLAKMMVGRDVLLNYEKPPSEIGEVVLRVEGLRVLGDRGLVSVDGVSFDIRSGEVFGIAGVAGNGQSELVEAIVGLRKVESGRVEILGRDVTNQPTSRVLELGVAYIPEHRIERGIAPDLSVVENLILKSYRNPPFSGRLAMNTDYVREWGKRLVKEYEVVTPSIDAPVKLLSGGNIQRVIIAREFSQEPKLIIASHPTYGLDVAATEYVRKKLLEQRRRGAAILLVSEDLEELLALSDRIAVMYRGRFVGVLEADEITLDRIRVMMAGEEEAS